MNQRIAAFLVLFTAAFGSRAVSAQTLCHAENDGPNFADNVSMGGPNLLLGIRFVSPVDMSVTAMEVFTGEQTGQNTLGIWSHDVPNNEPDVSLGSGAWNMVGANSWQGASMTAPIPLLAGQTYWVVWGPRNGSQASVDVPMTFPGQVYRGSFDGGQTWNGPWQHNDHHWKFRLYGNCGGVGSPFCFGDATGTGCPCGNTGGAGEGCANSGGTGGLVSASGSAGVAADDLAFAASALLPSQPALLFAGQNAINGGNGVPFGDGLRCAGQSVVRLGIDTPGANGDAGWGPGLGATGGWAAGETRYFQVWYRDPGGPCGSGFNLTNGVGVTFTP